MDVTPSGSVMDVRPSQLKNASIPMDVMPSGRVMEVRPSQL